jgi:hypothetical protein
MQGTRVQLEQKLRAQRNAIAAAAEKEAAASAAAAAAEKEAAALAAAAAEKEAAASAAAAAEKEAAASAAAAAAEKEAAATTAIMLCRDREKRALQAADSTAELLAGVMVKVHEAQRLSQHWGRVERECAAEELRLTSQLEQLDQRLQLSQQQQPSELQPPSFAVASSGGDRLAPVRDIVAQVDALMHQVRNPVPPCTTTSPFSS